MMTKQGFDELEKNLKDHTENRLNPIEEEIMYIRKRLDNIESIINLTKEKIDNLAKKGFITREEFNISNDNYFITSREIASMRTRLQAVEMNTRK